MKKKLLLYFSLCILTMLLSCNDSKDSKFVSLDSFKSTVVLSHKKIDSINQLIPGRICFVDSLMIVTDWDQNPRIHIYNKNNYSYLGNYGDVGRGPQEFISPECLCQNENDGSVYLNDYGTSKIYKIDLKNIISNEKSSSIIEEVDMPAKLFYSQFLFLTENEIRGDDREIKSEHRYFVYDRQKKEINWKGDPNFDIDFLRKVKVDDRKNAGTVSLAYSKEKEKIVSAFLLFNRIDIMNFDFEVEKKITFGNRELLPISKVPYDKRNIHYFGQPLALENSFLVPYKGVINGGDKQLQKGVILQFDYDGNPINKFILEKPIESLFYDQEDNQVYAITDDLDRSVVLLIRSDNEKF